MIPWGYLILAFFGGVIFAWFIFSLLSMAAEEPLPPDKTAVNGKDVIGLK